MDSYAEFIDLLDRNDGSLEENITHIQHTYFALHFLTNFLLASMMIWKQDLH